MHLAFLHFELLQIKDNRLSPNELSKPISNFVLKKWITYKTFWTKLASVHTFFASLSCLNSAKSNFRKPQTVKQCDSIYKQAHYTHNGPRYGNGVYLMVDKWTYWFARWNSYIIIQKLMSISWTPFRPIFLKVKV